MSDTPRCTGCGRTSGQDGCSRVLCPARRPWGSPVPPASTLDPIGRPGSGHCGGFKVRAKKGQE